ncbi:TonB-dependent receptor [Microbulbifer marinus]|uniref:Iron complex outermembrane recepter protein n=1 Tax=Microbulbifer marinus TaxID=658218 RepID=A0A1H3X5I6_9GAMM|nr:TonB-dependent receptor [Microbulbifer marinus]SDZ94657.1 iron complex outermembrane recepter protein [Microbulbifer marinus]
MLNRNKLALSISAAVLTGGLVAPLAVAQTSGEALEEVTVTGIRGSLQDALSTKRNAGGIVDAISAEDVGKFPDKNVAESLSRITGVAVSREFGEGEKVSIRGAGPDYNRTTLNGQSVGTADWFILDNPARSFNFTLLPSTLISSLEVSKSPQASQDEGSLGGTVNVRTHRPLDLDAGEGSITAESVYSESSEEFDPSVSGQYSWKNDSETFGILVAATKQDRTVQRSGFEVLSWTDEATPGTMVPGTMGAPTFYQERERETIFVSTQFRATDELLFTLDALDTSVNADNMNGNWLVFAGDNALEHVANGQMSGSSVVASEISGAGRGVVNWINRVSSSESQSYTLTAEYDADAFSLDVVAGQTSAEGGTYRETSWEYGWTGGDYAFDLRKPSLTTNPAPNDAEAYGAGWIWGGEKPTTDEETYFQVDLELPIDAGAFTAIKTGIKSRSAERTQDRTVYSWHGPGTLAGNEDLASEWPVYLQYIFNTCPTLASCDLNSGGTVNIDSPVAGNATNVVKQVRDVMEEIAFSGLNGVPADYARSLELANIWAVEEDIFAVYAQAEFEGERYRGNFGLRYVTTDQASSGYEFSSDSWGFKTIDRDWLNPAYLEWVTEDNDYSEFLPSFNIAYDLNDDMVVRTAVARVMARQNWNQISAFETFGSLNAPDPQGQSGNPFLEPFIADQLDVSYEWYYGDVSAFSATTFVKKNHSYLAKETYTEARYDEQSDSYVDVDFSRDVNGPGGLVAGVELAVLHDFDNGFGLQANYTYTSTGEDTVVGISDTMANLMGYYENDTFGARLMYNYRSEWSKGFHWNGNPLSNDAYGQWDASFSYSVTDNAQLTFEAVNLTDEQIVEYSDYEDRLMSLYENGRRFVIGARYDF